MSFKNLEQRFNEKINDLYAAANYKFEGGRASTGRTDDPLMVQRPGDARRGIVQEGRSVPFVSSPRDVIRLTLFSLSPRGLIFLAKQQLLQTGNTFEQTRLLNPAFVVGNAVPFLHIRRTLRPIRGQFGITASRDSISSNSRLLGQLQVSTYDTVKARYDSKNTSGNFFARIVGQLRSLAQPFTSTYSAITAVRDVGEKYGRISPGDNIGWKKSRPELETIVRDVDNQIAQFQTDSGKFFEEFGGGIQTQIPVALTLLGGATTALTLTSQPFLKYFIADTGAIKSQNDAVEGSLNARDLAKNADGTRKRISYIKDPANNPPSTATENVLPLYSSIPPEFEDSITVSFAMGTNDHVQFRAFITELQQNSNPEYKINQYIGRIEKFISYVTVQRTISFKLQVLAFSKDELNVVWRRINYLNAFVFPYGFERGILQPNIIRGTIGQIYVDQPMYITNMAISFNEYSWDIDSEVPIAADISIEAALIEKTTSFANKPFFGIVDKIPNAPPPIILSAPELIVPDLS
jgi:hypothetical protein